MLNVEIKKYLDNLSKEVNSLLSFHVEFKIAEEIKNILKKEDASYKPSDEDIAEQIAFDFLADYPNGNSGWGIYKVRCLFCRISKVKWLNIQVSKKSQKKH